MRVTPNPDGPGRTDTGMLGVRGILDRVLTGAERIGLGIAALSLVSIVLVTVVDVVCRYAFHRPLGWSYPVISNFLLAFLFCFAVSDAQRLRQHVGVDAVLKRLPARGAAMVEAIGFMATCGVSVLVAAVSWGLLKASVLQHEVIPGIIDWPTWPTDLALVVGFALLSLRLLLSTFHAGGAVFGWWTRDTSHDHGATLGFPE
jgi:TRAP-type C4-dicarboxylate transport system permease small subunit